MATNKNLLKKFKANNWFLMAALDHRGSLKQLLSPRFHKDISSQHLIDWKKCALQSLAPSASAVLLDVDYGLAAFRLLNLNKPYLLAAEKSGYILNQGERLTEIKYSPAQLKKLGAAGVKLLLYYNPFAFNAKKQEMIVSKLALSCKKINLPFLLEIVTYNRPGERRPKFTLIKSSLDRFLNLNLPIDIYKLEFPGSLTSLSSRRQAARNCGYLTDALGSTPWILLSAGHHFSIFKKQVSIAHANGAQGFLAGRALWQDFNNVTDKEIFWRNIVPDRFQELVSIFKT